MWTKNFQNRTLLHEVKNKSKVTITDQYTGVDLLSPTTLYIETHRIVADKITSPFLKSPVH